MLDSFHLREQSPSPRQLALHTEHSKTCHSTPKIQGGEQCNANGNTKMHFNAVALLILLLPTPWLSSMLFFMAAPNIKLSNLPLNM